MLGLVFWPPPAPPQADPSLAELHAKFARQLEQLPVDFDGVMRMMDPEA